MYPAMNHQIQIGDPVFYCYVGDWLYDKTGVVTCVDRTNGKAKYRVKADERWRDEQEYLWLTDSHVHPRRY